MKTAREIFFEFTFVLCSQFLYLPEMYPVHELKNPWLLLLLPLHLLPWTVVLICRTCFLLLWFYVRPLAKVAYRSGLQPDNCLKRIFWRVALITLLCLWRYMNVIGTYQGLLFRRGFCLIVTFAGMPGEALSFTNSRVPGDDANLLRIRPHKYWFCVPYNWK